MTERERLIVLVQRIIDGDHPNEEGLDSLVAEFEAAVKNSSLDKGVIACTITANHH